AVGVDDAVLLLVDVVREAAADAAVRAHALDLLERLPRHDREAHGLVHQRPGGARGHALAARDARALAHRLIEIERDARRVALAGATDDVVVLDVVARPDAAIAQDAGLVVDRDHLRRGVAGAAVAVRQPRAVGAVAPRQRPELVVTGG